MVSFVGALAAGWLAAGCGSPPSSVTVLSVAPSSAPSALPPLSQAEALAARVAQLKRQISRDPSGVRRVESLRQLGDELAVLLVWNAETGNTNRREAWVVNAQSEVQIPGGLEREDIAFLRVPGRSLVLLTEVPRPGAITSTLGLIRVGPTGELTAARAGQAGCGGSLKLVETVCGEELICPEKRTSDNTEEDPALGPSECSERRGKLADRLAQSLARLSAASRAPFEQASPETCSEPPETNFAPFSASITRTVRARLRATEMRSRPMDYPEWELTWASSPVFLSGGCQDRRGNYLLRVIGNAADASPEGSSSYAGMWQVRGGVPRLIEAAEGPWAHTNWFRLGDLDGDGVPETSAPLRSGDKEPVCRLYSLTMKPSTVPMEFCEPAQAMSLPDRFVVVTGEKIFGLEKGSWVLLTGPGSHEKLQRVLDEDKSRYLAVTVLLDSLLQAPEGWGHREAACTNPIRQAWAAQTRDKLLSWGFPLAEAKHSVLVLSGLGACPPAGLGEP